jgi:hypothetical protein
VKKRKSEKAKKRKSEKAKKRKSEKAKRRKSEKAKKRKRKILSDGFGYNFKEKLGGIFIWLCCKRGYRGQLKTDSAYVLSTEK